MTTAYQADYYVNILDTSGVRQAVVTDFGSLSYLRKVNAPGLLQFGVRGDHPLLSILQDKWQAEVYRKIDGAYTREFVGLARQSEFYWGEKNSQAVLTFAGILSMLSWRIVAWKAGTANRSKFTTQPGETIMKALVSYNAGTAATVANGRIREGAISGVGVELDGAHGATIDWYCAYEKLLENLQKLAPVAGGDFDLIKSGTNTFTFHWYTGQRGDDLTADVIFALERGNMANPQYKDLRVDEKTVCIVGGRGEGTARAVVVRTGDNYSAGNDIEMFSNGSNSDSTAGLNSQGDANLVENRAKTQFSFDVLQTPATRYGVDYDLGDLVTAVNPFTGAEVTLKVDEVRVAIDDSGKETIGVGMVVP